MVSKLDSPLRIHTILHYICIILLCVCKSRSALIRVKGHAARTCFYLYSAAIGRWYARAICAFRTHLVKGNGSTSNPTILDDIQEWIDKGRSFNNIAVTLRLFFSSVTRGLSARSLRRFFKKHSIGKAKGPALDFIVSRCIRTVGCYI